MTTVWLDVLVLRLELVLVVDSEREDVSLGVVVVGGVGIVTGVGVVCGVVVEVVLELDSASGVQPGVVPYTVPLIQLLQSG